MITVHADVVGSLLAGCSKKASCRLLKKIQRRGARKIDERRRTSAVR